MRNIAFKTKAFIDTNILVDFVDPHRPGHQAAQDVFQLIFSNKVEAAVSTQSILDVVYIGRRSGVESGRKAKETLLHVLAHTNIQNIDSLQTSVALKDPDPDVEDSAHIAFAYDECCDVIITNDKKLLSREVPKPMLVMTPEAFVDKCRA